MQQVRDILNKIKSITIWSILLIILSDWLQYFIYMLINFFNYRSAIPTIDLLLLAAIFISPLLCALSIHYPPKKPVSKAILYLLMPILAIMLYVYYLAYFQLGIVLDQNPGFASLAPITGFATGDENLTKRLMFLVNAIVFLLFIPISLTHAFHNDEGSNKLVIGKDAILGFVVCSAFMGFRSGSMLSTPLRIAMVLLIGFGIFLSLEIFTKYSPSEETPQINNLSNNQPRIEKKELLIPLRIPVLLQLSLIFGIFTLGDFGVLYGSHFWFIGIVASSILLRSISGKIELKKKIRRLIAILWFAFIVLYSFAGIIGPLIDFLNVVKVGLILSGFAFVAILDKEKLNSEKRIQSRFIYKAVEFYFGLIFLLFGLLSYFFQPFTNIAIIILAILVSAYIIRQYF